MASPAPRALQTLTTLFAACAILAGGGVALRLLAASRQGWALPSHDLALLAIDGLLLAVNLLAWVALRRAWTKARAAQPTQAGAPPPP